MKLLIFTLAVIMAAGYLGYSQSADVRKAASDLIEQVSSSDAIKRTAAERVSPPELKPVRSVDLELQVTALQQQVRQLERELDAMKSAADRSPAMPVSTGAPAVDSTAQSRSDELLALARRMELKAIGH